MTSDTALDMLIVLVPSVVVLGLTLWLASVILRKAGFSGWWALVMLVPVVNLVMVWVFAYADWPALAPRSQGEGESRARPPRYEAGGTIVDRDHRAEDQSLRAPTPAADGPRWRLTGFDGAGHAVRLEFTSDEIAARDGLIIGRSQQHSDLVLDDTSVSRRHARLFTSGGYLRIEDLASANGTAVNGHRLAAEEIAELGEGAELTFGETALRLSIA